MKVSVLDCTACHGAQSMKAIKIYRFSGLVAFIGWILALPSIIGIAMSVVMFFVMAMSPDGKDVSFVSVIFGLMSLSSGVLGYFLIMKKKVYRCSNCGYVIDRA